MKPIKYFFLLILLLTFQFAFASPEVIYQVPKQIYVPQGFDDNDNAQIVFEDYFPNSCYRAGLTLHKIDLKNKIIVVESQAYFYSQEYCLMVLVPYKKTLNFGILPVGNYKIFFKSRDLQIVERAALKISKSTNSGPDDYLYAPVLSSEFTPSREGRMPRLTIKGIFTNTCFSIDHVKVMLHENSNTIDVLPIAKVLSSRCQNAIIPFEHEIRIDYQNLGKTMLHIRSLNGQAVNNIVDL